jgi:hypothetical protein
VELLNPPRTGPVTGDVVRRRAAGPDGSLSAFHADVLPAHEAKAAGGAAGGTGGGPANVPPSKEMGGEQVPNWKAEKQQQRTNARNRNHKGELDGAFVIREKPPTPLQHEGDRVPWRPTHPLSQKGQQYVRNFLTAVTKSRRDGRPSDHEDHAQGGEHPAQEDKSTPWVMVRPPQGAATWLPLPFGSRVGGHVYQSPRQRDRETEVFGGREDLQAGGDAVPGR